ncbi:hypothetical protein [Saccharopolyspora shandongensis]|uniref:hypothetical protein n=1 Tax=Saccharopolyspora shandongensis TaxID=418495 RepID=UPI00115FAAEA|nr:hypothetical protein [Saccharopolyspora shandongensis]
MLGAVMHAPGDVPWLAWRLACCGFDAGMNSIAKMTTLNAMSVPSCNQNMTPPGLVTVRCGQITVLA